MSNARVIRVGFRAIVLVALLVCCAPTAWGQMSPGNNLPGVFPLAVVGSSADPNSASSNGRPANAARRAPLARLIENPDETGGAPPYALTDQSGTIQRYVEPVPGIDLSPYVGQVISVRHDTGSTLLASQLELPPRPLTPIGNKDDDRYAVAPGAGAWRRSARSDDQVEPAQYVENDDASVQLLPDDVSISDGGAAPSGNVMPLDGMSSGSEYPVYADPMGQPGMGGQMYGSPYEAMPYGPGGMMPYPGQMMGPCPNCGRYHSGMDGSGQCSSVGGQGEPDRAHLSADIELMMLRPQVSEDAIGKLSENYQFSPRIILGLRGVGNFDGRVRFWHYDHESDLLGSSNDVRFNFDVLDIEALHRFEGRRSELALSAGVRLAGIHLKDPAGAKSGADFIGITAAGDGLTPLGRFPGGHVGLVYGARLSLLGGDWGGDDTSTFINHRVRDDNVLTHELYGGVEVARRVGFADVRARLLFEMQNWRSDVLTQDTGIESIGFFGPALQIGADF
jgi:hypothetical protein